MHGQSMMPLSHHLGFLKIQDAKYGHSHLGHIISSIAGDSLDVAKRQNDFNGQVNNMLCFFGKLPYIVKSRLFCSYCTSFYRLWVMGFILWSDNSLLHCMEKRPSQGLGFTLSDSLLPASAVKPLSSCVWWNMQQVNEFCFHMFVSHF